MLLVMGTITDIRLKSKALLGRIPEGTLTVLIVILACSLSFGLGLLAGRDTRAGELQIEEVAQVETLSMVRVQAEEPMAAGGQYVASRTGKSYHLPWCGGAKQIKEENKVWFATKEAAEAAGYTAAKNCPGI